VSIFNNRLSTITAALLTMLLCFSFDACSSLFQCPFFAIAHFECPGCGLQRSLILLLEGKPGESIAMYWATIPMLTMFVYCFLYLIYRYRNGLRNLIFFFSLNCLLIFCNYLFKITNYL